MVTESALADAEEAGLRYVSDSEAGISRVKSGRGFRYVSSSGQAVTESSALKRIRSLVIPPAWTRVWICSLATGHIQATGRDQKGRKQFLYHPKWRAHRDGAKFQHLREFGKSLPKIRETSQGDLRSHGLSKKRVVAAVVQLLEATLIRVGNRHYAVTNDSHGLTTMDATSLHVGSTSLKFKFKGKSNKFHEIEHRDRKLARVARQCQDLPGQPLFQYLDDDGNVREVTSDDVNKYLQEVTGKAFTAKDFRTWAATIEMLRLLRDNDERLSTPQMVKIVAEKLGNTAAVCKKSYIHPELLADHKAPPLWLTARTPKDRPFLNGVEQVAIKHLLS